MRPDDVMNELRHPWPKVCAGLSLTGTKKLDQRLVRIANSVTYLSSDGQRRKQNSIPARKQWRL
jgi:hypothetical protein